MVKVYGITVDETSEAMYQLARAGVIGIDSWMPALKTGVDIVGSLELEMARLGIEEKDRKRFALWQVERAEMKKLEESYDWCWSDKKRILQQMLDKYDIQKSC